MTASIPADDYPFDLGDYRRAPASGSPEAQRWFDRGLLWAYGFNHEEATACFERAVAADGEFALAHWGIAYASGPNYNKGWDAFDELDLRESITRAHEATAQAVRAAGAAGAGSLEADLARALTARYPFAEPRPPAELERSNEAYAAAMAGVYEAHPGDLDVAALYADALMNVTPWALWDLPTGEPAAGAHTVRVREVLETAMAAPGGMRHPGVLHLYIHLMEMSPEPEAALPAGDALRELVPAAGHLIHMPTHIDVLLGDYARVVTENTRASVADERFLSRAQPASFYTLYHAHDHHFRIYGAMFAGRRADALAAAADLRAALPEELLRVEVPPMADWLESFVAMGVHTQVRFGMWEELIAAELPADPELYCVTAALTLYGAAVASAATGDVAGAEARRARFADAAARVPESRTLFNNTARDILAIAEAMLDGEIAYRRGAWEEAWTRLRRAIELDDTLPYDEPWGWMQPTRHAYGALLLEQGLVEPAAAVYAADLGVDETLPRALRHPDNVWSLHGYHECLTRLGRDREAAALAPRLARALAGADVTITSSCFCRTPAAA